MLKMRAGGVLFGLVLLVTTSLAAQEARPSSTVSGQVLDRETRRPLAGAYVWPAGDLCRFVHTDETGTFQLAVLPSDSIEAAAQDHLSTSFQLQGKIPRNPLLLTLAPASGLTGLVTGSAGRPLQDVEVRVSRRSGSDPRKPETFFARSSAAGAFRVPGLRPGESYAVTATLPGFAPASTAVTIPSSRSGAATPAVRLVLRRGRTASGRVVDPVGRPVRGARVELTPSQSGHVLPAFPAVSPDGRPHRAETDPEGRFKLRNLPSGWFDLRVESPGFTLFERTGLEIPEGTGPVDLGRFLLELGTVFRGRVGDAEGKPLAGAEVWRIPEPVRDWTGLYDEGPAAVTGPDGTFTLRDLPRGGTFGLDVCRRGFLPLSATVREIPAEPFRAVLMPAAALAGRVLDPTGAPVAGARVNAWLSGESPDRPGSYRPCLRGAGSAMSDGEGRFRLGSLPSGWWSLRAAAAGYLSATREKLHVLPGESAESVVITLGEGAVVTGRIATREGQPAAGARVWIHTDALRIEVTAAGDGAYRLAGVAPGERWIEASISGGDGDGDRSGAWGKQRLVVQPGENRLDLTLDQGSRRQEIRGRIVTPDGAPVGGALVLASSSEQAYSADDGSFALSVEDDYMYNVWAKKEGYAPGRAAEAVRVAGSPVEGVEVRLGRGGVLTGHLLGLHREDLATASLEVELPPPFKTRAALDPQGGYRVEEIPPGEWTVTARAGDRVVRERIALAPGDTVATLDLSFDPTYEVSGWVLGPAGEPISGAFVRFSTSGSSGAGAYSRADGSFRARVEDGTYRVWTLREGYARAFLEEPVTVEGAPVDSIELRLGEAATVRGRILGLEPGERARDVWAAGPGGPVRQGQLDQEGGFVINGLPPGEWTILARYGNREGIATVSLSPGQSETWTEVEMEATPEPVPAKPRDQKPF